MKNLLLMPVLIIALLPLILASSVERSFSTDSPEVDDEIEVNLTITFGDDPFVIIQENTPSETSFIDRGESPTTTGNILRWDLDKSESGVLVKSYKVSFNEGKDYVFSGSSFFPSTNEISIIGETDLTVFGDCIGDSCDSEDLVCEVEFSWNLTECSNDMVVNYTVIDSMTDGCSLDNFTIPENESFYSDCDNNNLIGLSSDIRVKNFKDFEFKVGGVKLVGNESQRTGIKKVEFIDDDIARVEFNYNFNSKELDLTEIEIKKQDDEDFGYLLVKGLKGNKSFRVDKLVANSSKVCIRDEEISSVGQISDDCDASKEYLVDCDGVEDNGFSCEIESNLFIVHGLNNSGVVEFVPEESNSGSSNQNSNQNSGNSNQNKNQDDSNTDSGSDLPASEDSSSEDATELDSSEETVEESDKGLAYIFMGVLIFIIFVVAGVIVFIVVRNKNSENNYSGINVVSSNNGQNGSGFSGGMQPGTRPGPPKF